MKTIAELNLGFSDAQNYSQRGNKQLFSSIFVKNSYLDDLLNSNVYFLIGEKVQEKQHMQRICPTMNTKGKRAS